MVARKQRNKYEAQSVLREAVVQAFTAYGISDADIAEAIIDGLENASRKGEFKPLIYNLDDIRSGKIQGTKLHPNDPRDSTWSEWWEVHTALTAVRPGRLLPPPAK